MNELVLSPEWQSDYSTFQWANGPNDMLCPPPSLFPGKLINPIVVSCVDRTEFCDWIQHFKAADVPVLTPPPPVYDIIYTPTHKEVRPALLPFTGWKQLRYSQLLMIHNYPVSYLHLAWWQTTWPCLFCKIIFSITMKYLWLRPLERSQQSNRCLKRQKSESSAHQLLSNIFIHNVTCCPTTSRLHSLTGGVETAKDERSLLGSDSHRVDVGPTTFSYPFKKTTLSRQDTLNPSV